MSGKLLKHSIGLRFDGKKSTALMLNVSNGIKGIVGVPNSGKSYMLLHKVLFHSLRQIPDINGVRDFRVLCTRATSETIKLTLLKEWLEFFPLDMFPNIHYGEVPTHIVEFMHPSGDGTVVKIEAVFRSINDEKAVHHLRSTQFSCIMVSEASESHPDTIETAKHRVGRYPSIARMPAGVSQSDYQQRLVLFDTNFCSKEKKVYQIFNDVGDTLVPDSELITRENIVFRQAGGLDELAENTSNIREGYYKDLAEGYRHNIGEYNKHVLGEFDDYNAGDRIYPHFEYDKHVVNIPYPSVETVIRIGMDFGRQPAAVASYIDDKGRVVVFDEVYTDNPEGTTVPDFIASLVKHYDYIIPWWRDMHEVYGDPSGNNRDQFSNLSLIRRIRNEFKFFKLYPAKGNNNFEMRKDAVISGLMGDRGEPYLLIASRCRKLIAGFAGGYGYKRFNKEQDLEDKKANKNSYSHIHDALQYAMLGGDLYKTFIHYKDRDAIKDRLKKMPLNFVNKVKHTMFGSHETSFLI